jgi:purine-binding chemotaxis protein CheW
MRSPTPHAPAALSVLIAPFGNLFLAVPMTGVQKVIRTPEIFKSGARTHAGISPSALGVAHFEERDVIVVDLHQKIYGSPNPQSEKYVIVTEIPSGHLYGVLATHLPTLITIPPTSLRPLPEEYRQRDPLGIASHVASIIYNGATQTVFLVDLEEGLGLP